MKILILTKKFPYPLREGEPIAVTYLSRALVKNGHEVWLLSMNTSKHFFEMKDLPPEYNHFKEIIAVPVNNAISLIGALKALLQRKSYMLSRFESPAFRQTLSSLLKREEFDIIQLETIYLALYIPLIREFSKARIALRAHNVEHEIWSRYALNLKDGPRKWYLNLLKEQLKSFEKEYLKKVDAIVAITSSDLARFRELGYEGQARVAPVGIDMALYKPEALAFPGKLSIGFIGALDWMPNQEGILWFMSNVWPEVLKAFPEAELHIAGRNMPAWFGRKISRGIQIHGEVADAKEFMNQHVIMIAPLFSGSGIKVKVLEAMALGRVVFATPVALEGIPATLGTELIEFKTAKDFVQQLQQIFKFPEQAQFISLAAREFIRKQFDNQAIAAGVISCYKNLLSN